jgi:hypothetical protein
MWHGSANATKRIPKQLTDRSSQSKNSAREIRGFDVQRPTGLLP